MRCLTGHYGWKPGNELINTAQLARINSVEVCRRLRARSPITKKLVVEDDVEERSVNVPPTVVVNEAQFASVKDQALQLPEWLNWRGAPQRGDLCAAILVYLSTGGRWPNDAERCVCGPRIVVREARDMRERRDVCHMCA